MPQLSTVFQQQCLALSVKQLPTSVCTAASAYKQDNGDSTACIAQSNFSSLLCSQLSKHLALHRS